MGYRDFYELDVKHTVSAYDNFGDLWIVRIIFNEQTLYLRDKSFVTNLDEADIYGREEHALKAIQRMKGLMSRENFSLLHATPFVPGGEQLHLPWDDPTQPA